MKSNIFSYTNEYSSAQKVIELERLCTHQQKIIDNFEETKKKEFREKTKDLVESYNKQLDAKDRIIDEKNAAIVEKDLENALLRSQLEERDNRIAYLEAKLATNGSNAGISTANTPINQKKRNPKKDGKTEDENSEDEKSDGEKTNNEHNNLREKTNRKRGKQPDTPKNTLHVPESVDEEDEILHEIDTTTTKCDSCGGTLTDTGRYIEKDVYDIEIRVVKHRHKFEIYVCDDCGKEVHVPIPNHLKEPAQYGNNLKAIIASMGITGNMAVNKIALFLSGITKGRLKVSEGFICKQYKNGAVSLKDFCEALKHELIKQPYVFWDDTVIMVDEQRENMRFYGNEDIALFGAHKTKNLEELLADNILTLLSEDTKVMHDHNMVNYNEKFHYTNLECNQHLLRDIQKVDDWTHGSLAAKILGKEIKKLLKDRKTLIDKGMTSFSKKEINRFYRVLYRSYKHSEGECETSTNKVGSDLEKTVFDRIKRFQKEYFSWLYDFNIPPTNNLSERALRCIKSHMKISGQFQNLESAQNYANLKSYVETCRRHGINEIEALARLYAGNPYTVEELFG